MMPHEWVRTKRGLVVETDSVSHGDDASFPGPTDIAWDLAGFVVEWDLDAGAAERFVDVYRRASGDDPRRRLGAFVVAHLAVRVSYARMAAAVMRGTDDEARFRARAGRYREKLARALGLHDRAD